MEKWGIYPWHIEHGAELIHPDDLEAFRKETNSSKVFECMEEGDYITLRYNGNRYRVKDKLFKPVPTPKYTFGEIVRVKKSEEEAVITDIMWHYDKQEHFYFIAVRGKRKSKRYWESEFVSLFLAI